MKQIRKGVFETNSSSTHVITIQKHNVLDNNKNTSKYLKHAIDYGGCSMVVMPKSFGWEHTTYYSESDKMMYLLIAVDACYSDKKFDEAIETINTWLNEIHIDVSFPTHINKKKSWKDSNGGEHEYVLHGFVDDSEKDWPLYIDHTEELGEFVTYIMSNKNHFYNFIFGNKSYIETGNDNECTFPWWSNLKYVSFDEVFSDNKDWWVQDGEDEKQVYEEMKKEYPDECFHKCPNGVIEFYKGN